MDRDAKGRFVVGHSGGPGRPNRQTEHDYLAVMMEQVSLTAWREIVRRAVCDAQQGDHQARRFLAEYLLPKPVQAIDLSIIDQRQLADAIAAIRAAGMEPSAVFARMIERAQKAAEQHGR